MSLDEDDGQCIRLLSFCKKHRQPSNERPPADESLMKPAEVGSSHTYSSNPSGCARSGSNLCCLFFGSSAILFRNSGPKL